MKDLISSAASLTEDTVIVVPLVFDEDNYLYSPLGYNLALDSVLNAQGPESEGKHSDEEAMGKTFFTTLATFESVVQGTSSRKGTSHEAMYPGRLGPATTLSGGARKMAEPYVQVWDPYSCMENPEDCPEPPPYNPPPYNPPPNNPPPATGRYSFNAVTDYGTTPEWPTLWRGDVISGDGDQSNPFGHTSIITRLNTFSNTGGSFDDSRTKAMEAVKEYIFQQDKEVEERPARTYWLDENNPRDVYVRYHNYASWSERSEAVSYSLAQDPDAYSITTSKIVRHRWYCSKLIWRAYKDATGDDLDHDWGYTVFPGDIEHSGHLRTVYRFRYTG